MDPAAQLARDGPKDEARMAELSFRRVKSLRWQHGLLVLSASWPGASVQEDHERKRRLAACWGVEVEVQMVQGAAHIGVRREEASAGPAQLLRYLLNTHPFTSAGYKDISLRDVRSAVSPFRRAFVSFVYFAKKILVKPGLLRRKRPPTGTRPSSSPLNGEDALQRCHAPARVLKHAARTRAGCVSSCSPKV